MRCPSCQNSMIRTLAKEGVLVDLCNTCSLVWLDATEINFFAPKHKGLWKFIASGPEELKDSGRACPACSGRLFAGKFPLSQTKLEHCSGCKGQLLSYQAVGELRGKSWQAPKPPLPTEGPQSKPATSRAAVKAAAAAALTSLPALGLTSILTLGGLYGILFAVLVAADHYGYIPENAVRWILLAVVAIQFILSPLILDLWLRFLGSLKWVDVKDLPPAHRDFILKTCQEEKIPLPRFGIIEDMAPNAFTYGHIPHNARLVVTRGILERLTPEEANAVIAHELGHITHWDFIVMTVAQLVPLILYEIYKALSRMIKGSKGGGKKKGAPPQLILVAAAAYVGYLISRYLVLYLSRIREYWADRFSGQVTRDPDLLSSALIKIGLGLAATEPVQKDGKTISSKERYGSLAAMGIADAASGESMALMHAQNRGSGGGQLNSQLATEAMAWDLWNPWALYYELHSTHPLIAKRVRALCQQAEAQGGATKFRMPGDPPESYWDEFLVDLSASWLPMIFGLLAFGAGIYFYGTGGGQIVGEREFLTPAIDWSAGGPRPFGWGVVGFCIGMLLKLRFSYPAVFQPQTVASLLRLIKVSSARGVAVKLEGKIIGKGVPGYIFSEDFVIEDKTGIIFLDYTQPLGILEFLFGVFRSRQFVNEEVTVEGWYRRAPVPYVEVKRIVPKKGGLEATSSTLIVKKIFTWMALVFVLILLMAPKAAIGI